MVLVAAHGGCGATTLTAHVSSHTLVREAGLPAAAAAAVDSDALCVVVATATADGTARAVRTLHHLERAGYATHQLRLALVRDGRGPMPVAARARLRLLSAVVDGIDVVPHVQRWRYESGVGKSRSRRYERAVGRLVENLVGTPAQSRALPMDNVHFYDDAPEAAPHKQPHGIGPAMGDHGEMPDRLWDEHVRYGHTVVPTTRAVTTAPPAPREAR